MSVDPLWNLFLWQTIQVSMVALVVWALAKLCFYNQPHVAHALWAMVLLKCLTPPLIPCPTSPFCWLAMEPNTQETPAALEDLPHSLGPPVSEIAPPMPAFPSPALPELSGSRKDSLRALAKATSPSSTATRMPSLSMVLLGIWVVGTGISLLGTLTRFLNFYLKVRSSTVPTPPAVLKLGTQVACKLRMRAKVRIQVVDRAIGPAVIGLFRPIVLLPRLIVDNAQQRELEPLLAHELVHIRRGDLFWAALQALSACLWWFHPLVQLADRLLTQEAERSCDEETIACLHCSPATYARSLLRVLEQKQALQAAPSLPGIRPVDITAKRMERIMKLGHGCNTRRPWWVVGLFLLGALVVLPGAALVSGQDDSDSSALRAPENSTVPAVETRIDNNRVSANEIDARETGINTDRAIQIQFFTEQSQREAVEENRSLLSTVEEECAIDLSIVGDFDVRTRPECIDISGRKVRLTLPNGATISAEKGTIRILRNGKQPIAHTLVLQLTENVHFSQGKTRIRCDELIQRSGGYIFDGNVWIETDALRARTGRVEVSASNAGFFQLNGKVQESKKDELSAKGTKPKESIAFTEVLLPSGESDAGQPSTPEEFVDLSLEDCVAIALQNSKIVGVEDALRQYDHRFSKIYGQANIDSDRGLPGQIIVKSLNEDLSLQRFERNISNLVASVEGAYWDLYTGYQSYESFKAAQERALDIWRVASESSKPGEVEAEAQARALYFQLRAQVHTSLFGSSIPGNDALGLYGRERALRQVLGWTEQDGRFIRPSSSPRTQRVEFQADDLSHGSSLSYLQAEIQQREKEVEIAQNLSAGDFSGTQPGLTPSNFGRRRALANLQNAKVQLAKSKSELREKDLWLGHEFSRVTQNLQKQFEAIQDYHKQSIALQKEARHYRERIAGDFSESKQLLDSLLRAEERLVRSQVVYSQTICEYNKSISRLNSLQGDLLARFNIGIEEPSDSVRDSKPN